MLRSVFVITRQPDTDAVMQPDYIRRNTLPADNRGRRQQREHHRETPAEHPLSIGPAVQGRRAPAFSHFTKDRFRRISPVATRRANVPHRTHSGVAAGNYSSDMQADQTWVPGTGLPKITYRARRLPSPAVIDAVRHDRQPLGVGLSAIAGGCQKIMAAPVDASFRSISHTNSDACSGGFHRPDRPTSYSGLQYLLSWPRRRKRSFRRSFGRLVDGVAGQVQRDD